ncbi:MAG: hypothetical protein V3V36_03650, partial [Candidatus Hydrothermarchaeaceae archaeon]
KLAFSKLDSDMNWVHSACHVFIEAVSKPQMAFEGKASRSRNGTTQPSGVRWGFEMTSNTSSNRC